MYITKKSITKITQNQIKILKIFIRCSTNQTIIQIRSIRIIIPNTELTKPNNENISEATKMTGAKKLPTNSVSFSQTKFDLFESIKRYTPNAPPSMENHIKNLYPIRAEHIDTITIITEYKIILYNFLSSG